MSRPESSVRSRDVVAPAPEEVPLHEEHSLQFLTSAQVRLIDQALEEIGPFGEVRLVKVKGRLRFIQKLESEDALSADSGD